jgi:CHAT domain-containing protein/tetratricopeptide (TPR) repeat protein
MQSIHRQFLVAVVAVVAMLAAFSVVPAAQAEETVEALSAKAEMLYKAGKHAEALAIAERAAAMAEGRFGPDHLAVASLLEDVARLRYRLGRYAEAEAPYRRALAIRERAVGAEHLEVAATLNDLAVLLHAQGRYDDVEPLLKRALAIRERALGPEHPAVGTTLNNLGVLYASQGRHAEAEHFSQRALVVREKALGSHHASVGEALNNLAMLFESQGRHADAERLLLRALAIRQEAIGPITPGMRLGPAHHDLAVTFNNLAGLYYTQGRYAEAVEAFKAVTFLLEVMLGPYHADVGTAINNIGEAYRAQGRPADAQPFFRRAISIWEKALGPDHTLVAVALDNLALSIQAHGHGLEAEPLYKRALSIRERAFGPDHPDVGRSLHNLAALAFLQRDWAGAADLWRRSTSVIIRRIDRGTSGPLTQRRSGEKARAEVQRSSHRFWSLAKAVYRLEVQGGWPDLVRIDEMFRIAQWAIASEAAQALARMGARGAKGNPALAGLVRERQDLADEWQRRDEARTAAVAQPPDKRDRGGEAANAARLAQIDARIAAIDGRLATDFPDYASFATPAPSSVAEVQAQLRPNEALVLFLDTPELQPLPEETFIWVVTRTAARWVRSDLGSRGLAREVAALRCGLDETAWEDAGAETCGKVLGVAHLNAAPKPLPFDHARAHKLYNSLFGAVEDLIKGNHLVIVPSGALTQLPFHVLVTEGVKPGGSFVAAPSHRVAWLARAHPITILPAVASLKALRRVGRPSAAPRPMIGFGNPLLDGPDGRYRVRARLSRTKRRCPETPGKRLAAVAGLRSGAARVEPQGSLADLSHIRMQAPLPETADELCAVARDVKAAAHDIRLGAYATEREVKRLSASGELAKYRLVHFATHGALAGELEGTREPGLILTPPETASAEDDGYLSASEIAGLKLDADWVILSACNTAAGGADNAEALSGLARAFIYAQARALLVSHWAVDSDATVKLVTRAVREMARDARVGRAEAMRRSMLALIDKGEPRETHPAMWAPFVVVGEGAPDR